jgi:hypothetical protein
MRGILAASLLVVLSWPARPANAQQPSRDEPAASLGKPIALADDAPPTAGTQGINLVAYQTPVALPDPIVARGQAPDPLIGPTLRPQGPGPAASPEPYNCGVVNQPPAGASGGGFWDGCKNIWGKCTGIFEPAPGRQPFQSDHAFDNMISPVTNPFYFEDPRALTEARPIFIFQQSPDHNYIFHGGDIEYFGVQGRVAITDWLSLDITKLGGTWMQPENHIDGFSDTGGFSELLIGPKFTFYRNESTGTVAAFGLTFDIPAGSASVFQDTGSLSLIPYLSVAQSFGRTSYGTFNAMGTIGYNGSVNNERSSNLFSSLHLDYDIANLHKIYPLLELNWFDYTSNGKSNDLTFEGADLFNFGSMHVTGINEVSLAIGARYKFCESIQAGFAVEFPIAGPVGLMAYRLTFDLIFKF